MAYPPTAYEGTIETFHEEPVNEVGVVSVHCWNVGEAGGPYPIQSGQEREGGIFSQWVVRAGRNMRENITSVLAAAREARVKVFHRACRKVTNA